MFLGVFLIICSLIGIATYQNGIFTFFFMINIFTGSVLVYSSYKTEYKKKFEERRKKKEAEQAEKERVRIKVLDDEKQIHDIKRLNYEEESKRKLFEARKLVAVSSNLVSLLKACGFSGSEELLGRIVNYAETLDPDGIKKRAEIKKGDSVYLGEYRNGTGTKKPIEWVVIDVAGTHGLLTSRYILEEKPFQTTGSNISWANSGIRKWLNNEFFTEAFTDAESNIIINKQIPNSQNQGYEKWIDKNKGEDATYDKVFLLSYLEAYNFFTSPKSRQCGTIGFHDSYSSWWLRSPGHYKDYTSFVNASGEIEDVGIFISAYSSRYSSEISKGVRPAIWVNLDSGFFHA